MSESPTSWAELAMRLAVSAHNADAEAERLSREADKLSREADRLSDEADRLSDELDSLSREVGFYFHTMMFAVVVAAIGWGLYLAKVWPR